MSTETFKIGLDRVQIAIRSALVVILMLPCVVEAPKLGTTADKTQESGALSRIFVCTVLNAEYPRLQWSGVIVTAVTVTVGYSDSFCNPRFIRTKRQAVTVTKNRLQ